MQAMGICSVEAKQSFERALSLLDEVPQHPLRGLVLSVLGLAYYMRGEPEEAAAIARRGDALWSAGGDRTALLCACLVHGLLEHDRGCAASPRGWLEKGVALVEELDASASRALFVADPGVLLLGLLAIELQQLGLVDQALERLHAARARAEAAPEPAPRQAACWLEAMCQVAMGNAEGVADAAERLARLQAEYDAPEGKAAALWFRGWAEAHLGDPRAGHRLIREGCEQASRIGMRAFAGETLGYAAEASMLAGDWSAARLELLGCTALCERQDATREELDALGRVVDRLTEGLDTPPVARARALLARPVRALL
jgi:tetratricopeptide (TPR) repeat protein